MSLLLSVAKGVAVVGGLALLDRVALWLEAKGYLYYRRRSASGPSSGSVLVNLAAVFEPSKQYVIEAKRQEHSEVREDGAPPGPERSPKTTFVVPEDEPPT